MGKNKKLFEAVDYYMVYIFDYAKMKKSGNPDCMNYLGDLISALTKGQHDITAYFPDCLAVALPTATSEESFIVPPIPKVASTACICDGQ